MANLVILGNEHHQEEIRPGQASFDFSAVFVTPAERDLLKCQQFHLTDLLKVAANGVGSEGSLKKFPHMDDRISLFRSLGGTLNLLDGQIIVALCYETLFLFTSFISG